MVKIGERNKMNALKQRKREQANRFTQRQAEKHRVSLGSGWQAAGGGEERASGGSATQTID